MNVKLQHTTAAYKLNVRMLPEHSIAPATRDSLVMVWNVQVRINRKGLCKFLEHEYYYFLECVLYARMRCFMWTSMCMHEFP